MNNSYNQNLRDFKKNGFLHLKNVIASEDISTIQKIIKKNGTGAFVKTIDFFLSYDVLYRQQYNSIILEALRDIYGSNYWVVNDINIQVEQYYNDRKDKGWHFDAAHEFPSRYLFKAEYGFCKVGLYTEANSIEFGGGIDVEIGGHKSFKNFGSSKASYFLSLINYFFDRIFLSLFRKKSVLKIAPGDVIIFDSRLPHRSTPRQKARQNKDNPKIAVYWNIAKDETNAHTYMKTAMKLAATDENNFYHYCKYLAYHFPTDYPSHYVENSIQAHQIISLSKNWASRYKLPVPEKNYRKAIFD